MLVPRDLWSDSLPPARTRNVCIHYSRSFVSYTLYIQLIILQCVGQLPHLVVQLVVYGLQRRHHIGTCVWQENQGWKDIQRR